ncbi:hypothetical protein [Leptospira santarosai]|uniref:hypothetical protein n=1 Tax=Leptospira santarosai TaxID=28183 RepID=UPI00051880BF|nr:hypothetical protein [Leptospira santarosai]
MKFPSTYRKNQAVGTQVLTPMNRVWELSETLSMDRVWELSETLSMDRVSGSDINFQRDGIYRNSEFVRTI